MADDQESKVKALFRSVLDDWHSEKSKEHEEKTKSRTDNPDKPVEEKPKSFLDNLFGA